MQRLERTLTQTREFLEHAQERVHRDIARVLADTIRPWLRDATSNRYVDVRIDPETLGVQVCENGGSWREATLLSHGTSEQTYLLVRMALAQHLAKPGESCPLILDDITVQSDRERKAAILDLLYRISSERQVVLFTQEDEVASWAEANLREPQHQFVRLDPATVPFRDAP